MTLSKDSNQKKESQNSFDFIASISFILIGTAVLIQIMRGNFFGLLLVNPEAERAKIIGELNRESGDLRTRLDNSLVWLDVEKKREDIASGEAVFTSANGHAEVKIKKEQNLSLLPNSLVVLRELYTKHGKIPAIEVKRGSIKISSKSKATVNLQIGGKLYQFKNQTEKPNLNFEVKVEPENGMTPLKVITQEPIKVQIAEIKTIKAEPLYQSPIADLVRQANQVAAQNDSLSGRKIASEAQSNFIDPNKTNQESGALLVVESDLMDEDKSNQRITPEPSPSEGSANPKITQNTEASSTVFEIKPNSSLPELMMPNFLKNDPLLQNANRAGRRVVSSPQTTPGSMYQSEDEEAYQNLVQWVAQDASALLVSDPYGLLTPSTPLAQRSSTPPTAPVPPEPIPTPSQSPSTGFGGANVAEAKPAQMPKPTKNYWFLINPRAFSMVTRAKDTTNGTSGLFASNLGYGLGLGLGYEWTKQFRLLIDLSLNHIDYSAPSPFQFKNASQYLVSGSVGAEVSILPQLSFGGLFGFTARPIFNRTSDTQLNFSTFSVPSARFHIAWDLIELFKINFGIKGAYTYYLPVRTNQYHFTSGYGYRFSIFSTQKTTSQPYIIGSELYYESETQNATGLNLNYFNLGLDLSIKLNPNAF